ncbi:hypothetical protein [Agromyces sp. PvR057]|uniref:hypothetical protein n=1 Tax=Agromyces sp. PvR057 TaxID=3156403 RepID=UPI0033963998
MLFVAPLILLFLLVMLGTLIFLVVWTINLARRRGRSQVLKTIGVWVVSGALVVAALVAWNQAFGRSPIAASAEEVAGVWRDESAESTSTIDLRSDGSAHVVGIPAAAVFEEALGTRDLDLPARFSGEGTWDATSDLSIKIVCESGETITLLGEAVQSSTGTLYLRFMAGDPDAFTYDREFSRIDSGSTSETDLSSDPAC